MHSVRDKGKGETQTVQSYAAEVKLRIQRWRQGEAGSLWKEAVKAHKVTRRGRGKKVVMEKEKQDQENASRSLKLVQEGHISRVAKALVSRGIDQHSAEAKQEMRNKHPAARATEIPGGEIINLVALM